MVRKAHRKKVKNSVFYCTYSEITYGTLDKQNWAPIFQEMTQKSQMIAAIVASEVLPKFLNSRFGLGLVMLIRQRELSGQMLPLKTVAAGLEKSSETFWLDMFKVMSESCKYNLQTNNIYIEYL